MYFVIVCTRMRNISKIHSKNKLNCWVLTLDVVSVGGRTRFSLLVLVFCRSLHLKKSLRSHLGSILSCGSATVTLRNTGCVYRLWKSLIRCYREGRDSTPPLQEVLSVAPVISDAKCSRTSTVERKRAGGSSSRGGQQRGHRSENV